MTSWPALHGGGRALIAAGCLGASPLGTSDGDSLQTRLITCMLACCVHAITEDYCPCPMASPHSPHRHELPREVLLCLHCSHMYHK
jgi:hypothetical protein